MDIPSKIASPSAFESLAQNQTSGQATGQGIGTRGNQFASMMERILNDAATRRRDQEQAAAQAADRRAAERKAAENKAAENKAGGTRTAQPEPARPEPAKPRPPAVAQAPRREEAPRPEARPAPKTGVQDEPAAGAQRPAAKSSAEQPVRNDANAASKPATKPAAARDAGTTGGTKAKDAGKATGDGDRAGASAAAPANDAAMAARRAIPADVAETDAETGGNSGDVPDGDPDGAVVVEVDLTITETTVELVTAGQSRRITDASAALALEIAAVATPGAVDAPDTGSSGNGAAALPDGAVAPVDEAGAAVPLTPAQLAAQRAGQPDTQAGDAAAAAGAAGGAPLPKDPLPNGNGMTAEDLKAVLAKAAESAEAEGRTADAARSGVQAGTAEGARDGTQGTQPFAQSSAQSSVTSSDDTPLPQSLAELAAAAKAKAGDKAAAGGDSDGGAKGDGQTPKNALAQAQPAQPQAADAANTAAQGAFLAAAAEAAGAGAPQDVAMDPAAKPGDSHGGATHPAIAAMEAPRAAAGADAPAAVAHLRPSRGSAGLPMGVQDQVAVHLRKSVADGNDSFTINLRPTELGRIDIRLEITPDGRVSAQVAVEKAQTLELLQRDSRNLERALQDAGLKADSDSLNFSLRGESGSPFQDESRQGGGSGRRGRVGSGVGAEVEDVKAAYTVTLAPDRVDIHA